MFASISKSAKGLCKLRVKSQVNFGGSFVLGHENLITCCLMCFITIENESSILNQILCKPLCLQSPTTWQTEAEGTMKVTLTLHA
jgi:hypothetical protein